MVICMWLLLLVLSVILWICLDDSIVIAEHRIYTDKVKLQIKLAVISDFHCGNAEEVLDELDKIQPDAVLIPGDLVDENISLKPVDDLLRGLRQWPCFYVSGNHEYKIGRNYNNYFKMIELLEEHDIVHLENQSCIVTQNEQKIWIGGVQDHTSDKTKDPDKLDLMNIAQVCKDLNQDVFSILLMHRPEQYDLVENYPVDVLVSGHAHGGQWRFPGVNGLFAPQQGLFPKRAGGIYFMNHGIHLVSRGLAHYWFLPRILNHREINVLILDKKRAD